MTVKTKVTLTGFFFSGNPVGQFRRNVYSVLMDVADTASDTAKMTLRAKQRAHGAGYNFALADQITKVPRRRRGNKMEVVVSANYGSQPLARKYNAFIDSGIRSGSKVRTGYRFYAAGARAAQSRLDAGIAGINARLVEGLT